MYEANFDRQRENGAHRERTAAQREASRLNGAKSRGPKNPVGRVRDAANAVHEVFFADKYQPPADYRQLDLHYRRIRNELLKEFDPTTFTERDLLDTLAHDYVQLVRVRQMIEMLAAGGPTLSEPEQEEWQQAQNAVRDIAPLRRLLALTKQPDNNAPLCTREEAGHLAHRFHKLLAGIEEAEADEAVAAEPVELDIDMPDALLAMADNQPPEPDDSFAPEIDPSSSPAGGATSSPEPDDSIDLGIDAFRKSLRDTLGDAWPKFKDAGYVTALLSGDRVLEDLDWPRIRVLMNIVLENHVSLQVCDYDRLQQRVEQLKRQNLEALAAAPEGLLVLEKLAREIEKRIEVKVTRLRG